MKLTPKALCKFRKWLDKPRDLYQLSERCFYTGHKGRNKEMRREDRKRWCRRDETEPAGGQGEGEMAHLMGADRREAGLEGGQQGVGEELKCSCNLKRL